MTTQTEAERLADGLERDRWIAHGPQWCYDAAAELRRQASFINDLKAEILEQCRINGMSAEREDALRAEVDRLKKALAEQPAQQEPVGCLKSDPDEGHVFVPRIEGDWSMLGKDLYTTPQAQRKPLTDEEIEREWQFLHDEEGNPPDHHDFARAIEFALGIKENT